MKKLCVLHFVLSVLLLASLAYTEVPRLINYQARLTDNDGLLLDTTVSMTFTIYDDEVGGAVLWSETFPSVTVDSGGFSVILGSTMTIGDDVFSGDQGWLGVQIGTDSEMSPRSQLTGVPYSFVTQGVDGDIHTDPGLLQVDNYLQVGSSSGALQKIIKDNNGFGDPGIEVFNTTGNLIMDIGAGISNVSSFGDENGNSMMEINGSAYGPPNTVFRNIDNGHPVMDIKAGDGAGHPIGVDFFDDAGTPMIEIDGSAYGPPNTVFRNVDNGHPVMDIKAGDGSGHPIGVDFFDDAGTPMIEVDGSAYGPPNTVFRNIDNGNPVMDIKAGDGDGHPIGVDFYNIDGIKQVEINSNNSNAVFYNVNDASNNMSINGGAFQMINILDVTFDTTWIYMGVDEIGGNFNLTCGAEPDISDITMTTEFGSADLSIINVSDLTFDTTLIEMYVDDDNWAILDIVYTSPSIPTIGDISLQAGSSGPSMIMRYSDNGGTSFDTTLIEKDKVHIKQGADEASFGIDGITITNGASNGYVMTSDANGIGTWQPASGGGGGCWLCPGDYTYLADINDKVGIGTETPTEKLEVDGNIKATGTITSGNSITIDGINNRIESTSGMVSFYDDTITTMASVHIGAIQEPTNSGLQVFKSTSTGSGDQVEGVLVEGTNSGTGDAVGVEGIGRDGTRAYGVKGVAWGAGTGYGVYGWAYDNSTNWAGYFEGNTNVNGTFYTDAFSMSSGASNGYVLTSDGSGNGTWQPAAGGWTDDGSVVRLENSSDQVGIGTASPNSNFSVTIQTSGLGGLNIDASRTGYLGDNASFQVVNSEGTTGGLALYAYSNGRAGHFRSGSGLQEALYVENLGTHAGLHSYSNTGNAIEGVSPYGNLLWLSQASPLVSRFVVRNNGEVDLNGFLHISEVNAYAAENDIHIERESEGDVGIKIENQGTGSSSSESISFIDDDGYCAINVYDEGHATAPSTMQIINNRGVSSKVALVLDEDLCFALAKDSGLYKGNLLPYADASYNLGSMNNRWANVYAANGTIQTSDARLKTGIFDLEYGLEEVMSLNPVSYFWKNESDGKRNIGLLAQDVQEVVSEAVVEGDGPDKLLGLRYEQLIPVLINAIKEQQRQIEELKTEHSLEMKELRSEVSQMQELINRILVKVEDTKTGDENGKYLRADANNLDSEYQIRKGEEKDLTGSRHEMKKDVLVPAVGHKEGDSR